MKQIDVKELISAMDELEKERGIKKEYLIEALEAALVTAYKKNFDSVDNVRVDINGETGEIHIYSIMQIVKKSEDPLLEISLADAKKIKPGVKVGETVEIEIVPKDFGRIAAQTAKQVVVQKIREAEREMVFTEYNDKKGEIVSGLVQKSDTGTLIIDLGKLEGIMPIKEQIPTEHYNVNDKIKGYVMSVEKGNKGNPQVIISRSHPNFVKRLFELEIPEIYEGLIEIKSVSREPGFRSKVAVYSKNENIDPVGSCVGQKGVRIQNIIKELNGEKIDVIEWSEDPSTFIAASLLPAQVLAVDVREEEKFAQVIVPDDQLSLAIGKAGQNARLAARLTSWKIDIKSESQFREIIAKATLDEEQDEIDEEDIVEIEEAEFAENKIEEPEEEIVEETSEENNLKETAEIIQEEKPKRGRKPKVKEPVETEKVESKEEKPKKTRKSKKTEESAETAEEAKEEKPKKTRKTKKTVEEDKEEKPKKTRKSKKTVEEGKDE